MFRQAAVIVIGSIGWAVPALANINLEYRPPSQTVLIGDTVNIGLYAVSDDQSDQLLMSAQVIIAWDPNFLQSLGNDNTGAVPLQSSDFPANDPFHVNEVVPPKDGDGLYVALAPLGNPVAATPAGTLLTTFQFLALADTPETPVDILESAGDPEGHTIVYDGTVPNLDVTGELFGATVTILAEPPPGDCDMDLHVDLDDYATFWYCLDGPGGDPVRPECQCADLDDDGDVDLRDHAEFQVSFTGER